MRLDLDDLHRLVELAPTRDTEWRDAQIRRYGFGVPTEDAVRAIQAVSPGGVVELGAGTGVWAAALADIGVDVIAYDIEPPPSPQNTWFAGVEPWHEVRPGDHTSVARHGDRTLLLVWPTKNEDWPGDALRLFRDAGGTRVATVGELPGGRTGDDRYHAMLGSVVACSQHRYQVLDAPCICDVTNDWTERTVVSLPSWPDHDDHLTIYDRREAPAPARRRGRWRR